MGFIKEWGSSHRNIIITCIEEGPDGGTDRVGEFLGMGIEGEGEGGEKMNEEEDKRKESKMKESI